jgi:chromate transport protein ChrA
MNRFIGLILICALAAALLFPAFRSATQTSSASRLFLGVWLVTAGIVAAGAWFPIRAPRKAQSWMCAALLWIVALIFLAAAFIEMAQRFPHD